MVFDQKMDHSTRPSLFQSATRKNRFAPGKRMWNSEARGTRSFRRWKRG
jgi:hypothetical protein